jgi:AcrR family transcriptional regulator
MELADTGGYDAVTMKAVADGSGVALATLYRWFTSKDDLLAEALLALMVEVDATLRAAPLPGATPADRLAAIMAIVGDHIAARPSLVAASTSALLGDDPNALALTTEFHQTIEGWIDLAAGDEPLRHRADATELLEHIIFSSLIALARGLDTPASVSDRLERAARLLLVGTER